MKRRPRSPVPRPCPAPAQVPFHVRERLALLCEGSEVLAVFPSRPPAEGPAAPSAGRPRAVAPWFVARSAAPSAAPAVAPAVAPLRVELWRTDEGDGARGPRRGDADAPPAR